MPDILRVMATMNMMRLPLLATAALTLALGVGPLHARGTGPGLPLPAHGVIGVTDAQLTPEFWTGRLTQPDRVILDSAAIATQNARLRRTDPSMHDLGAMSAGLSRTRVAGWIQALSVRPDRERFDVEGRPVPAATFDALVDNLALAAIPDPQPTRYGLVVRRADLRTFPTALRVFSTQGDTDIDRFQESALFPGTPVVIAHRSRDRDWLFVVSPRYAGWIQRRDVAEGTSTQVLGYGEKRPYRVITGASERTVFTPEQPQISQLQLEMGVRVPVLSQWPADQGVNGQHPYTAHVIELPVRAEDGGLRLVPALLPRRADSSPDYLPLTPANLIRQGFKFLGERYGWGDAYNGRDCSSFVSEVYRSMGVQLPRNTSDQATSPALNRVAFTQADDRAGRLAAVRELRVGDLVYIPGHVMMTIGQIDGEPYVIHDTAGINLRDGEGTLRRVVLNGVSVSPLTPLQFDAQSSYVDRITSIVRIRR